jgi:hypothetical protein
MIENHWRKHDNHFSLIEHRLAALRCDVAVSHELILDHGDDTRSMKARLDRTGYPFQRNEICYHD